MWHFFDGAVLATYLVSTATFCNPMTRTPLTRDDCRALDEYLLENGLRAGLKDVLVTHAYDLLEMTRKGQDVGAMISRSQREATTVLNSLFGFSRYEPPPDSANTANYVDSYVVRGDNNGQGGATLGEAVAQEEPEPTQVAPPPAPALDESAFPGLSALGLNLGNTANDLSLNGLSFADQAAKPAAVPQAPSGYRGPSLNGGAKPTSVKVPREIWVPLRNARVFEVQDPLERYRMVAANHDRRDVVDLHFQSSRTAPVVLQHVLDTAIRANPSGVWVVTGSGHHAPRNSHQQKKASLFNFVGDYLAAQGYSSTIAKDHNGFAGAYLVQGPARGTAARPDSGDVRALPDRRAPRVVGDVRGRTSRLERGRRGVHSITLFVVVGRDARGADVVAPQGPCGPPNEKKKKQATGLRDACAHRPKKTGGPPLFGVQRHRPKKTH